MKRTFSILIVLSFIAGFAFASGTQQGTAKAAPTTLQIFSMATNSSGIQNDPLATYMKDNLNLIVDWLPVAGETAV